MQTNRIYFPHHIEDKLDSSEINGLASNTRLTKTA